MHNRMTVPLDNMYVFMAIICVQSISTFLLVSVVTIGQAHFDVVVVALTDVVADHVLYAVVVDVQVVIYCAEVTPNYRMLLVKQLLSWLFMQWPPQCCSCCCKLLLLTRPWCNLFFAIFVFTGEKDMGAQYYRYELFMGFGFFPLIRECNIFLFVAIYRNAFKIYEGNIYFTWI